LLILGLINRGKAVGNAEGKHPHLLVGFSGEISTYWRIRMRTLYMIEISPDLAALHRFLKMQGLGQSAEDIEFGYGIHAWLGAAFGKLAPKPWRLLVDKKRPPRLLGYSYYDESKLREYVSTFAEPLVFQVCRGGSNIVSKEMPLFREGQSVGFEVVCCPVGRKAGSGIEKDIFLIAADNADRRNIDRQEIYCEWLTERLEQKGLSISHVELSDFRMAKQMRRTRRSNQERRIRYLRRPHALFKGVLTIDVPGAFQDLLANGVGRHRAFGYGMVLLKPLPDYSTP